MQENAWYDYGMESLSTGFAMRDVTVSMQMTLEKFGKLSDAFMKLGLRDEEVVSGVIDMLVEKAQMEPHFSRFVRLHGRYPSPRASLKQALFGRERVTPMCCCRVWKGVLV